MRIETAIMAAVLSKFLRQLIVSGLLLTAVSASGAQAGPAHACFQVFQSLESFEALLLKTREATRSEVARSAHELKVTIQPFSLFFSMKPVLKSTLNLHTGVLTFEIRTRDSEGSLLYPDIEAKALFHLMMESMRAHEIRIIHAQWFLSGSREDEFMPIEDSYTTNTDQFRAGLAKGEHPAVAARATWTGRMAALYGFTKVQSIQKDDLVSSMFLHVEFVRP